MKNLIFVLTLMPVFVTALANGAEKDAKRAPAASATLKRGQSLVICGKGSSVEVATGALNDAINFSGSQNIQSWYGPGQTQYSTADMNVAHSRRR